MVYTWLLGSSRGAERLLGRMGGQYGRLEEASESIPSSFGWQGHVGLVAPDALQELEVEIHSLDIVGAAI